jgi:hypothetical protein
MIGFDGRLQWRQHKLFKLRAKLPQRKKAMFCKRLCISPGRGRIGNPLPKFAIRSFFVRRTINKQALNSALQASSVTAIIGFGAFP